MINNRHITETMGLSVNLVLLSCVTDWLMDIQCYAWEDRCRWFSVFFLPDCELKNWSNNENCPDYCIWWATVRFWLLQCRLMSFPSPGNLGTQRVNPPNWACLTYIIHNLIDGLLKTNKTLYTHYWFDSNPVPFASKVTQTLYQKFTKMSNMHH